MAASIRRRLAALLAGLAVVAATVIVASPASAASTIEMGAGDPKVTKVAATMTLTAAFDSGVVTEPGVAYVYQWFRVNRSTGAQTAISGATKASYALKAADYPYKIAARIKVTKAGYTSVARFSIAKDYSLRVAPLAVGGSVPRVGNVASTGPLAFSVEDPDPTSTSVISLGTCASLCAPAVQWLRNGTAIPAGSPQWGTGASYEIRATDLAKKLSYRLTASYPQYLSLPATTSPSVTVTAGVFGGTRAIPTVVQSAGAGGLPLLTATADPAAATSNGTIPPDDADPAISYQWYRAGVAIAGKKASTYQLSASDHGKVVTVRASYTKTGYATVALESAAVNYSVMPGGLPVIEGPPELNSQLTVSNPSYTDGRTNGSVAVTLSYQWLRNGVAIAGTDASDDGDYTLLPADKGKKISVRVTAKAAGLIDSVTTSATTQAIGTQVLAGWNWTINPVSVDGTSTDLVTVLRAPGHGITPDPLVVKYQWYRDSAAIKKATAATYKLTSADVGKKVWVRITVSKKATGSTTYTTVVKDSNKKDYSIVAGGAPVITIHTTFTVGEHVSAHYSDGFTTSDGPFVPDQNYVWMRNGVAIAGAPNQFYYALQAADVGKKISVRITNFQAGGGYIPVTQVATTPVPTLTVQKGTLEGPVTTAPTVELIEGSRTLQAFTPEITGSGETNFPQAGFTYTWLRDGFAIPNETSLIHTLTSADWGKEITVIATANLAGYNSATLPPSAPVNYSINVAAHPNSPILHTTGSMAVGDQLDVQQLNFVTKDGPLSGHTVVYQWLRNGADITGATEASYTLAAADKGKTVTLRLTVSKLGYVTLVYVVPNGSITAPGVTSTPTVTVTPAGVGTLGVTFSGLTPATPAPAYAYKWYRADPSSPNTITLVGSASTYKLVAADAGQLISVQVTMSRPGFTVPTTVIPRTGGVEYTLQADDPPTINGAGVAVGTQLGVNLPVYTNPGGGVITPTVTYQWRRNGAVIASGENYTLVAADSGKTITVTVSATHPGLVPLTVTTAGVGPVTTGSLGLANPSVAISDVAAARKLTVTVAGITQPDATYQYQWFRQTGSAEPVAISGQTGTSYTLNQANDYGKRISVRVIVSKTGYESQTAFTSSVDWSLTALNGSSISGTPMVGEDLTANPPTSFTSHLGAVTPDEYHYQWLRNGATIAGQTGSTYTVVTADGGATLSVRITVIKSLLLSWVGTPAADAAVPLQFAGSRAAPTVSKPASSLALTATLPSGSITTSGAVISYQWHRTGGAIPGATTNKYTVNDPNDYGKTVWMRVTVTKPGYTTLVLDSVEKNYSIARNQLPAIPAPHNNPVVNSTMTFDDSTYYTNGDWYDPPASAQTIIWLADNVPVAPEYVNEFNQFTPQAVHVGKKISVQVITTRPGWVTSNATSTQTNPVAEP